MGSTPNQAQQRVKSVNYNLKAQLIFKHSFCPHRIPGIFSKDNLTFGHILFSSSKMTFQAVVIIRKDKTIKNSPVGSTSPDNQEAQLDTHDWERKQLASLSIASTQAI